jgi:hypothetical protein
MNEADDDLRRAVLKAMQPLPCVNPGYTNSEQLEYQRRRCVKWRTWAESAELLDERTRLAYLHWIEYCEYQNARGEEELKTGRREKEYQEYLVRRRAEEHRTARIKVATPVVKF